MTTEYPVKLKKDLQLKDGGSLPVGTSGVITFPDPAESKNGTLCFFNSGDETHKIETRKLDIYFGYRIPSETTIRKWMSSFFCKSVTGKNVEPDGFGDDNSPSWLLALEVI